MQINTDQFTYHNGTFTAEASTILHNTIFPWTGFELVSERTGKIITMILDYRGCHRDREGDVTHWVFKPAGGGSFNNLIIFND